MTITELRILPPLAIGRLGAASRPMDNYEARIDPQNPLAYRTLVPAETLDVDSGSGEITRSFVPDELSFTEGPLVRPVAPFLEVWAVVDGELTRLTVDVLAQEGLSPANVSWRVHAANLKVSRRTGDG